MAKLPPLPSDQTAHVNPDSGKPSKQFYNWLKQISSQTDGFITADDTVTLLNKTFGDPTDILGGCKVQIGSDATGDIWYRNASGLLTRLPIGSAGNVLTVAGTPALPSWAAPAPSGVAYLGTVSVSAGAIADTTILAANNSAYRSFKLILKGLVATTASSTAGLQVHSGGSFQATGYLSSTTVNGGAGFNNNTSTTQIALAGFVSAPTTGVGICGELTVSNLAGTSAPKSWWAIGTIGSTGANDLWLSSGSWDSNGAIDGFHIIDSHSSSDWAAGSVDIYGLQ